MLNACIKLQTLRNEIHTCNVSNVVEIVIYVSVICLVQRSQAVCELSFNGSKEQGEKFQCDCRSEDRPILAYNQINCRKSVFMVHLTVSRWWFEHFFGMQRFRQRAEVCLFDTKLNNIKLHNDKFMI